MNTCKTCRHWRGREWTDVRGVCYLISVGGDSGTHLARIHSDDDGPLFLTAPTYGCNLHEPIEED